MFCISKEGPERAGGARRLNYRASPVHNVRNNPRGTLTICVGHLHTVVHRCQALDQGGGGEVPPQGGYFLLPLHSRPAAASTRLFSQQGPRGQRQHLAVTDTASEEQQAILYGCGRCGI